MDLNGFGGARIWGSLWLRGEAALAAPAPAAPGAAQGAAQGGAAAEPQQLLGWITFEERLRMI